MNSADLLTPWLAPLGWIALEATVVVLVALAAQPIIRTAAARRSLWRAALLALVAVLAAELTGTGSQLPAQLSLAWQTTFPKPVPPELPAPAPEPTASFPIPYSPSPMSSFEFVPEPLLPSHPLTLPPASLPTLPPAPTPAWPAAVWLAGLAALLARSAWTHAGFAWLRLRHFLPAAEALRERVQALATRLGLRRRVRVLASERLRTPAAFGWLRPGVVVPGDFTARFAPAQQDVMLAHELAHLAARDPLWQLLADLVTAALWWHPLAWVARRQHRIAGELAADDASLALPNGPIVLAECLLVLGHEAADCPRAALGMAGFHSQLGRRIERLLALPRRDWQAPSLARLALQTAVALAALAALALLPGCAANRTASEAPSSIVTKWWQVKNAPVAADVRRLQSNAERGMRNAESSQSLVTSSPTNVLDISVGRQLLVDDFLIESNSLQRTWHKPAFFTDTPLVVLPSTLVPPGLLPVCDRVWYDSTNQLFKLRFATSNAVVAVFNSPDGTNWALGPTNATDPALRLSLAGPRTGYATRYESHGVNVHSSEIFLPPPGANWTRDWIPAPGFWSFFSRGRASKPTVNWLGEGPFIPAPAVPLGAKWVGLYPSLDDFFVVGRNLYFYFGGQVTLPNERQAQAAVGLATLRRDGFASLDAGPEGGVMTTKPVTFTGRFMFVNMKTNTADGEMRIEILDADGNALERFSRAKSIALAADQTLMGVSWQGGAQNLSELPGKPVRFRFHLKDASLYSFWVGPENLGRSMGRVAGGGPHFTNDVDTIGNRSYRPFPVVSTNTPAAPKPGASLQPAPAPVAAHVRRLTYPQTPDAKPRTPPASQSLLTSAAAPVQLAAASPKGLTLPVPNPYFRTNAERPFLTHSSLGARWINRKLDQIVLPEIHFDGVPLKDVVNRLIVDVKRFDPDKKGLNFLIHDVNRTATATPALDPNGNPIPAAQPVPLSETLVHLSLPLKGLTLREALDAICKTSEGGAGFTVEEYAVAFIPRGPGASVLFSRTFRVSPDAFMQGLQGVVSSPVLGVQAGQPTSVNGAAGQPAAPAGGAGPAGPVRAVVPPAVPAMQNNANSANALIRQFFQSAGLSGLSAPNSGTRVQFNPQTGALVVQGTAADLRAVEQAIQRLQPGTK